MDLHRRRSTLVRMTEDACRLGMARITNSPQELRLGHGIGPRPKRYLHVIQASTGNATRNAVSAIALPGPK
jgi:hypothetical protein